MRMFGVLVLLAAVACSSPSADSTPAVRPTPDNPVVTGPLLIPQVTLRITGTDGPSQLSDIVALEVGDDGTIFVFDYLEQRVMAFDAEGNHRWNAGRQGQGPGEFAGASGLALGGEGRVWVWDSRMMRFTSFSPEGELVETYPRPVSGSLLPWPGRFGSDGRLIDWNVTNLDDPPGRSLLRPIATVPETGDTVAMPAVEHTRELRSNGRTGMPYGPGVVLALDQVGSIWFAHTDEYRVYQRSLEGDTLLSFTLEVEPAPVTAEELDSVVAESRAFSTDLWVEPDQVRRAKPVVRRIFATPDGCRVYVIPEVAGHALGSILDVFDGEGVMIGRYAMEEPIAVPFPVPVARGEDVWYVTLDPVTDVPVVLRVRLPG